MAEEYSAKYSRFWELDFLRGAAITAMILFHVFFDMNYFANAGFALSSGIFLLLARFAEISFILLVGICLTISYRKALARLEGLKLFSKYLKRGAKTFFLGVIITIVTFVFLPEGTIFFGVLHFIGVSVVLAYFFLKFKFRNFVLGIVLILAGLCLSQFYFDFSWLFWLGFHPQSFYAFDYFPLLPWFGLILIGICFGNILYTKETRNFRLREFSRNFVSRTLCFMGRHSLLIYFLHQPILVGLILLLTA